MITADAKGRRASAQHSTIDKGARVWAGSLPMARPLRIERAGAWYYITARGNERKPIYREPRDYQRFCELLGEAAERFRWRIHAYVLLPNHFHLLIETLDANLSASMHWLGVSYSMWFNWQHW